MNALTYRPLFVGVWALQTLAALTVALSRFPTVIGALIVTVLCSLGFGAALACAHRLGRRGYVPGNAAQLAQIATVIGAMALWVMQFGFVAMFVTSGIVLLVARNATLTTRRALYFDLAILLTIFYDAVGARELPLRWPLAIAFLLVLLFVLMAEYTDRRLAYLRLGDTPALKAMFPGMRNTVFATALVLALAGIIYVVMPQPKALELALTPDDRGPPNWLLGLITSDAGPNGPSNAREDNKGNGEKGNESSGDGAGSKGQGSGEAKGGQGDGKGGGETGTAYVADGESKESGGSGGNGKGPLKLSGRLGKVRVRSPSAGGGECGAKPILPPATDTYPVSMFVMRADRPLHLRTHAYAVPDADCWRELPMQSVEGQGGALSRKNAAPDGVMQPFEALWDLDDRLPSAYMFTTVAVDAANTPFKLNQDWAVSTGAPIRSGTRFGAKSTVHYLGDRAAGPAESAPPPFYAMLPAGSAPRVRALAQRITAGRGIPSEKAIALEQYLRANYKPAAFAARQGVDGTEQFLFETHGGRSRQFANALATMLRAAGIPSRVVSGYRARRYNPLNEAYEIWESDRHHWVEAYIETGWVTFEPSPWAVAPAKTKPATPFEAAREYVRLAREPAVDMELAGQPVPRVKESYLHFILVWAWFQTYGKFLLLAGLALMVASWHWRRWVLPLRDLLDRVWLRGGGRGDPAHIVRRCYEVVELMVTRRGIPRGRSENHTEYLERIGRERPHLHTQCAILASLFGSARYGRGINAGEAADAMHASRLIAELLDEPVAA